MTRPASRNTNLIALSVKTVVASLIAMSAAHAADPVSEGQLDEVVVFGRGETRQVSTVGALEISKLAPGSSALLAINSLPGVSVHSADPFGAYEWSARVTVRGFNQTQMGFTLDGVPLGDMSYGNHNGLHISRAIATHDIGRVVLSQGAGTLETASSSNLGGTLQFFSRDPARQFGVDADLTGGSDSMRHVFLRADSGEIGNAGTRGYLSFTDHKADKWKGVGQQNQRQIDFKIVQPLGQATLTGFYNDSDRAENDYQDLSFDMIKRLGYDWDNISNNWPLMVNVAKIYQAGGSAYPAPIGSVDDAYPDAAGLRKDKLAGVSLSVPFADGSSWDTTVYQHKNEGQGIWYTPYLPTPVGAPDGKGGSITAPAPISVRTTEYAINRKGFTSSVKWQLGSNLISAGLWYENNNFDQARRFYGLNLAASQRSSLSFMKDPFFTQWQYAFTSRTTQFFVQDTIAITDEFKINAGFKSLNVRNIGNKTIENNAAVTCNGSVLCGTIEANNSFLPQIGFNYSLSPGNEFFGDVTRNMRAFVAAATGASPFATTLAGFNGIKDSLKPETSTTFEAGYRFAAASVQGVATVYLVDFKDRLLGYAPGSGIQGNPTILQNVGAVRTKGAELGLRWTPANNWSWYNSLSMNDSTYQDDVKNAAGTVVAATAGKQVADSPKLLLKSEFGYDNGGLSAKLSLDHTGKRYFTYTNDLTAAGDGKGFVDAYTTLNLSAGYRMTNIGFAKELGVQLNVTNLTDQRYISTIGSNGFGNSGDNQTFLSSPPRQYFLSVNGKF
jgi:iron complex outermembrane receptor protein